MTKRLIRSRKDAVLGGVCGGLGEYFDADANLVRLLFILFAVLTGFGILVYLALWLLLPEEERAGDLSDRVQEAAEQMAERARAFGEDVRRVTRPPDRSATPFLGLALVLVGVAFLLRNLGIVWMRWFALGTLWPIFPLLIGVAFLWRWLRGGR